MPDWFHYKLCGEMANEYTNSSTTGLVNAAARTWDKDILKAAGIPLSLFPQEPVMPGIRLGKLLPGVAQEVGFSCDVILPATHDTASAFMAVPAKDDQAVYLSSGTWSLLGVENETPVTHAQACASGFTNEGGYGGSIRFLRNIMGLWVLQCIRHEWNDRCSFSEMADMAARGDRYTDVVDLSDNRFLAPASMIKEVEAAIQEQGSPSPQGEEELLACVNRSLARCYADSIRKLERLTGKRYTSLNIVGGGSQNTLLNQWTADAAGLPVYAGPSEGTALGNVLAQLLHYGELGSLSQGRALLRHSLPITAYEPRKDDKR